MLKGSKTQCQPQVFFTNVKITDPKKPEAFINALNEAANVPYEKKERGESHILTDHEEIRKDSN